MKLKGEKMNKINVEKESYLNYEDFDNIGLIDDIDKSPLQKLLDLYTSFGIEQNYDKLLEKILIEAMNFTNCDAGTLYIKENDHLHFKIIQTKSLGIFENLNIEKEHSNKFPPVPMTEKNACAYCAIKQRIVSIEDVYSESYDFTGTAAYDKRTGYKTKSMLIVPMENDFGEVIGVVQLINALKDGKIVPFKTRYNDILHSFGVQAGMCLNSMIYAKENLEQIHSIAEVLTTAIDKLSKFNANHSRNMAKYCENFMKWLDENDKPFKQTKKDKDQLLMSIRLHDIGKLTTPQSILNKETRLGDKLDGVLNRIEKLLLYAELAYKCEKISYETFEQDSIVLLEALDLIQRIDTQDFLSDEDYELIKFLGNQTYISKNYKMEKVLKEDELVALSVRRGNITDQEREVMQDHVSMTEEMLKKIKFSKDFENVTFWASAHHELINGKGYPYQLPAEEIPVQVRIITVIDIFEALVATDRPYKKAKTVEEACDILNIEVKSGKLDAQIVALFIESKAWEL